ncbi:MAG: hypothetical protein ABFD79_14660 [Phycisphaerales bacterium]
MDIIETENMFHKLYKDGKIPMGTTSLINHANGIITDCVVWALGGIWFFEHVKPEDSDYQIRKQQILRNPNTLHWIKQ